jgi:uroporphyrin-III C-methyltransferase/precorrin-2 dehydrogenase/sirohydrochlorin ferrochelatase
MRYLPLGIDVRDRPCVVIGGGPVGARKALTLHEAGADVTVVSPKITDELASASKEGRVRWVKERFRDEHISAAYLVVMATDNHALNAAGALLATQECALACDASSGRQTQVIFGALLQEEGVTIATFSGGVDPALARRTRDEIARLLAESRAESTTNQ